MSVLGTSQNMLIPLQRVPSYVTETIKTRSALRFYSWRQRTKWPISESNTSPTFVDSELTHHTSPFIFIKRNSKFPLLGRRGTMIPCTPHMYAPKSLVHRERVRAQTPAPPSKRIPILIKLSIQEDRPDNMNEQKRGKMSRTMPSWTRNPFITQSVGALLRP